MKPNANRAYAANKYDGMSPERVVLALYDGAIRSMDLARDAIEENDQRVLGEQVSKAMAIISELQASLDKEKGGEIGDRLDDLYTYVMRGLLEANVSKDADRLVEVCSCIKTVRDGWAQMCDSLTSEQQQAAASNTVASDGYM